MPTVDLSENERLTYRFLAAVDIEGFSRLDVLGQRRAQVALDHVLKAAAARSRLDRERWTLQVSGDGELAVLPPDADGSRLVADYPRALAGELAAVNRARRLSPRLRVRLALHHGTIAPGQFGPVGEAPIVVSRLLDCDVLRQRLVEDRDLDLAVVVSRPLYHDVVRTRLRGLEPRDFSPVGFDAKGMSYVGYLYRGARLSRRRTRLWR